MLTLLRVALGTYRIPLNSAVGWWWADPLAGYVLVCYAAREVWAITKHDL